MIITAVLEYRTCKRLRFRALCGNVRRQVLDYTRLLGCGKADILPASLVRRAKDTK